MFDQAALAPYVREAMLSQMMADPASGSSEDPHGAGPGPYLAMLGGNAADALTTMQAMHAGRGREGNPLMPQNAMAITGIKAALTVPEMLGVRQLAKTHPTAAKVLGYGIGALGAGLAARNSRVGR